MCQGCVEAGYLSQETHDAIEAFLLHNPDTEFGPAHVVLGDDNVDDVSIDRCLARVREELSRCPAEEELIATALFLEQLRAIPEDER